MIYNILDFVQNNLAGHWIINIIVFIALIITYIAAFLISDADDITTPLKPRNVYLIWLFGGLWGAHWVASNRDDNTYSWCFTSVIATIVSLVFLTFDMFEEQYSIVGVFLLAMIIFNLLWGAIKIPGMVAKFNARYYRRHIDTDLIMSNKPLPVDNHIIEFKNRLEKFDNSIKDMSEIVDDTECGTEDADTSFFKNLFTLGNYNKLEREKARLRMLADVCDAINSEIEKNNEWQLELEDYLTKYRSAAFRNLNLCKDLLGLLKTIDGKKQSVVTDNAISVPQISTNEILSITNFKEVKFDSEAFGNAVMMSIDNVNNSLTSILDRGDSITSTDLKDGAIEVGISAIANGIAGIIDLNAETTKQRENVQSKIENITEELTIILPELLDYKAKILRQLEILSALKEMCVAFIKVYEPLRENVYDDKGGMVKGYREFLQSEKSRNQLGLLIAICNNYSKINQMK